MNYSKLLYHLSYVFATCVNVGVIYHFGRVYTADTWAFLPHRLPGWYLLWRAFRRSVFVLLGGFIASCVVLLVVGSLLISLSFEQCIALLLAGSVAALIGNHQERQIVRKRLESKRHLDEELSETALRLMKEDLESRI
jgi:hypothetical protein